MRLTKSQPKVTTVLMGAGMYVKGRAVHAFRRTFATETLKNTDIRVTQESLDHKDIFTTQIYTHIVAEQKKGSCCSAVLK